MPEDHLTEYKESWRDEYLKWICGFANAQGGTLIVGKADNGTVVGIANAAELLERLPTTARSPCVRTTADVYLRPVMAEALARINPHLPPAALEQAIDKLLKPRQNP